MIVLPRVPKQPEDKLNDIEGQHEIVSFFLTTHAHPDLLPACHALG